MRFQKLLPLMAAALLTTAAAAAPIKLTFVSDYATNADIPLFDWSRGHSARGEAELTLPDDTLLTTGRYSIYYSRYDEDYGGVKASEMPVGFVKITIPNYNDDTSLPLPGFIEMMVELPGRAVGHGVSFTLLEDGTIRGSIGWAGPNDESISFSPNSGGFEGSIFDGQMVYNSENMPGYWLLSTTEVPEPGTLLLLTGALAGLALSRRRRQS